MAALKTYSYPEIGEWALKTMSYVQAVRVENRIVCAGQGGWDRTTGAIGADLDAEIDQAFANVDANLRHAGGQGWSQVYRVVTYSTDLRATHDAVVRNLRRWMPDQREDGTPGPKPVWTEVGVAALGLDTMHLEIEVEAFDPEGAAKAREESAEK